MSILLCGTGVAQIGGRTAHDGPFTLDDAEDLDLIADGVMRDWISDYVYPFGYILSVIPLQDSGLRSAPDQSPIGTLKAGVMTSYGFINCGFGVPMPAVPGASTLTDPGDITSFEKITFLACYQPTLPGQYFSLILETYPGPEYPQIVWQYEPALGKVFQKVEIELRSPKEIVNAGGLSLEDLLSQTRFLYFYFYAGPVHMPSTFECHFDDIRLEGIHSAPEASPTCTSTPIPMSSRTTTPTPTAASSPIPRRSPTPTPTSTWTPVASGTPPPFPSPTSTATSSPSATRTASPSGTTTTTPTIDATETASPSGSPTATPTEPHPLTETPTAVSTPTGAATPTVPPTLLSSPTPSAQPPSTATPNGTPVLDGRRRERIFGLAYRWQSTGASPDYDLNGDSSVDEKDLLQALRDW